MMDLDYDPNSLLPPCTTERVQNFEKWLSLHWERTIRLPQSYVDHVLQFHGGCPGKACFTTEAGRTGMIGRFFNFLECDDLTPPFTPTWRQWSGEIDVRLDYRIRAYLTYEFWCIRMEDVIGCLPIAGVDTAGHNCRDMDEMNLLCLDYVDREEPTVVVWEFDNWSGPVIPVAPSFADLLGHLFHCPSGVVSGPVENW